MTNYSLTPFSPFTHHTQRIIQPELSSILQSSSWIQDSGFFNSQAETVNNKLYKFAKIHPLFNLFVDALAAFLRTTV